MSSTLKLYRAIFGANVVINDCDLVGVDEGGEALFLKADDDTVYSNGMTPTESNNEESKLNNREHIIAYPLVYLALAQSGLFQPVGLDKLDEWTSYPARVAANAMVEEMEKEMEDNQD